MNQSDFLLNLNNKLTFIRYSFNTLKTLLNEKYSKDTLPSPLLQLNL